MNFREKLGLLIFMVGLIGSVENVGTPMFWFAVGTILLGTGMFVHTTSTQV